MCVYQATQDGSRGLTFTICFNHGIRVLSRWLNSRIICRSLIWLLEYTIYSSFKISLPMGVNDLYFIDKEVEKNLSTKCSRFHFVIFSFEVVHYHWVHNSAPEISSPLSYGRIFVVDHSLQFLLLLLLSTSVFKLLFVFIGCATSAPDGSSPRGYSQKFSGIGSKKYNIVA
jgi:hypothetical protein